MGHDLDQGADGTAAFADSRMAADGRTDAWHKLGQTIGREMTPDEALELAHMKGWNVRKIPLTAQIPDGPMVEVAGKFLIVRDSPFTGQPEPLGVIGRHWEDFSNEETTDLLYNITEQSGAHIDTIGSLDGGRRTFVTMKFPAHMEFRSPVDDSLDTTELYLALLNHHDGQGSLRGIISPVRIVCKNTQQMAEGTAVSEFRLRHVGSPTAKLAEIRDMLGMAFRYQDTFAAEVQAMIDRDNDELYVREVLNSVFGVDRAETERQKIGRIETATKVMKLYRESDTVAPFRGTRYGTYNAVTEYLDHFAPVRTPKGGDEAAQRAQRSLVSAPIAEAKGRAFALLSAS